MSARAKHALRVYGSGETTLLFVHGLGCNQQMWRYVAPAFSECARIALIDLVGFGRSDVSQWSSADHCSLSGHARDVAAVARELGGGVVLVGHSTGAMIGLLAEVDSPELFKAHVMIAPSPCYLNSPDYSGGFSREAIEGLLQLIDSDTEQWALALAPQIMGHTQQVHAQQELHAAFCQAHPPAFRALARATFLSDLREQLALHCKPTLVLQCDQDTIAPIQVGQFMSDQMPQATLEVIRNVGHCPQVTAPDACVASMQTFLRRNSTLAGATHFSSTCINNIPEPHHAVQRRRPDARALPAGHGQR